MEARSNQYLGTEPLGKLMRQYALPCIISLLVGALYNIVDQIFIANASYLGSYGNAANTVVFPLTVVALAIAVMAGALVNIILDPIFIFVFRWGMMGAAVVTVAGQIVISIVVGMAAGCIPIVGFNMGAGKKLRVRDLFTKLLTAEATVGAVESTALSMIREVVFGVGFALLLPVFFGLNGVLYSMPVSDILTFVIAVFLIRGTYKELEKKQ